MSTGKVGVHGGDITEDNLTSVKPQRMAAGFLWHALEECKQETNRTQAFMTDSLNGFHKLNTIV